MIADLGVGRILVRSLLLGIVVFTALSVPQFSPVMNFVGAATIPLGCVILPCLFHLWMNAAEEDEWSRGILPSLKQSVFFLLQPSLLSES